MSVSPRHVINRRNAARSTGPRAPGAKRRIARNALRHGLSVPVFADPTLATEVIELAERLVNRSKDPRMREIAVRVASAQIDVERVRHARHLVIAERMSGASAAGFRPDGIDDATHELVALDRYEKRVMSRRKSALLDMEIYLSIDSRST